jgi:hypothetical protein
MENAMIAVKLAGLDYTPKREVCESPGAMLPGKAACITEFSYTYHVECYGEDEVYLRIRRADHTVLLGRLPLLFQILIRQSPENLIRIARAQLRRTNG